MITGQEKPDAGTIRIGDTVDLGYVDQSRDELNPDKNVWEEISDGLDMITLGKKSFRPALMSASSISKAAISRKSRAIVGRRTQPRSLGENAAQRRQRDHVGRTDQRFGRRYSEIVGRRNNDLSGLRFGNFARPLVS